MATAADAGIGHGTTAQRGALVFDLDGTLVDSAPDIAAALNATLAERGLGPLAVEAVERLTGAGAAVLVSRALAEAGAPASDEATVAAVTARYLRRYAAQPCVLSAPFADAVAALPRLRAAGFALGVCTNKPEALARAVLAALDLDRWFGAVVGADTLPVHKPDPAPLLHTIRLLGASPARATMIGDTAIDRRTAEAAGVRCRLVAWARPDADGPLAAPRLARFVDLLREAVSA